MADTAWIYKMYSAFDERDMDRFAAFLAEDCIFEIPGRQIIGRTAIASFLGTTDKFSSDERDEVGSAVCDGEMFAAQWHSYGTRNADGVKFDYRGATIGRLRKGLIVRWTDYFDPAEVRPR